ncbi:MAG: hypothetical protein ABSD31_15150 [Candidatus Binataceae bacterium]
MVEIPPGCDEQPDFVARIQAEISKDPWLVSRSAVVTGDAAKDDAQLVEALVKQWSAKDAVIEERWKPLSRTSQWEPAQELNAFFSECVAQTAERRIAVVRRFDKLFGRMSPELLATMRSLEQEDLLVSLNCSALTYEGLYERRLSTDASFTSDYGQFHSRLTIGPLTPEEAEEKWVNQYRFDVTDRLGRAYLSAAYELSGGLRAAFAKAAAIAMQLGRRDPDIRVFRTELADQLPSAFSRLFAYDKDDLGQRLVEAAARMHLGTASRSDRNFVASHRWNFLLLRDGADPPCLRSEPLGRKAVELMRKTAHDEVDPALLYQANDYKACMSTLKASPSRATQLLRYAADMMAEVFGDSPRSLYFGPKVKWTRVKQLATEAAALCREEASKTEFKHWIRISRSHEEQRQKTAQNADLEQAEDLVIRLALRVAAVAQDPNPVTAAYTAIPLVEDVLRHYVSIVLKLPATGAAFKGISESEIDGWWKNPISPFEFPPESEPLSGVCLALLAACGSARIGKVIFDDSSELSELVSRLDSGRNLLGHYVTTPSAELAESLANRATILLDRMFAQLGSQLSVAQIRNWANPPRRFLMEQA